MLPTDQDWFDNVGAVRGASLVIPAEDANDDGGGLLSHQASPAARLAV
ncbi:MAG: hypothetical protein P8R42_19110 [Candidatus Binatia bacterium]|nr:hypothetical protein [Candidatus Binatia bacterium]